MKKTAINEIIFMEVGIGMREGKVMATGSKRGSSADVTSVYVSTHYHSSKYNIILYAVLCVIINI